jgi:hypothetical protein
VVGSDVPVMAWEIISAGYRALVKVHHRDHGGESATLLVAP